MASRPCLTTGLSPRPELVATTRGVIEVRPNPDKVPDSVKAHALGEAADRADAEAHKLGLGGRISHTTWGENVECYYEHGSVTKSAVEAKPLVRSTEDVLALLSKSPALIDAIAQSIDHGTAAGLGAPLDCLAGVVKLSFSLGTVTTSVSGGKATHQVRRYGDFK